MSRTSPEPGELTKHQRRSRRRRAVRARTVNTARMTKRELAAGRALFPEDEFADVARPKTRADCRDGVRPCPFIACEHHLYLDVSARTGAIKINFPDVEPDELEALPQTCALDVSERGGASLERVGELMNLTRERVRQLEVSGLAKCQANAEMFSLRDFVPAPPKRRLPLLEESFDVERFVSLDEG